MVTMVVINYHFVEGMLGCNLRLDISKQYLSLLKNNQNLNKRITSPEYHTNKKCSEYTEEDSGAYPITVGKCLICK